jgi:hypothetical protein
MRSERELLTGLTYQLKLLYSFNKEISIMIKLSWHI